MNIKQLLSDLWNVRKLRAEHDTMEIATAEMSRQSRVLQALQGLQDRRRYALHAAHPALHDRYFTKDGIAAAKKECQA